MNPLRQLNELGQSVWLDNLRRKDLLSGALQKLIDEDGLKGLTSNPTIFQKAVEGSHDYDDILASAKREGLSKEAAYERLVVRDIQGAADLFRPVYERTEGRDGYVSLEVSPGAAFNPDATLREARHLWKLVGRENLMIKVPGTEPALPVIEALTAEGINVNITLLFAQERYRQVAEAYIRGLERFGKSGGDVRKVASVASFFVSRIDSLVDGRVEKLRAQNPSSEKSKALDAVEGKVAIANAKLAYRIYQQLLAGDAWKRLAKLGARSQRLLWASTSTKNPKYRDVIYVEELVGPDTVNTMPPATVDAFRDHGKVRQALTENVAEAERTMQQLAAAGISMKEVTDELVQDGVRLFAESFDRLVAAISQQVGRS